MRAPYDARVTNPKRKGPSGTLVLLGLVGLGLAFGAGVYRIFQPRAAARTAQMMADAPTTDEGRVAAWVEFGGPIVLQRLRDARISGQQPWIVTHTVGEEGEPGDVWGIESDELPRDLVRADGMRVVVTLPAPELLAHTVLVGDHARSVPRVAPGQALPDAAELLERIARYALKIQIEDIREDIEGAELVVEVAPSST